MPITLLMPTFNRLEFTMIALSTLIDNTSPFLVKEMLIVDTGSADGTLEYVRATASRVSKFPCKVIEVRDPHVVKAMCTARDAAQTSLIAKIDSDTVVPVGWLEACYSVMMRNQDVWAVGVEPHTPVVDVAPKNRSVRYDRHVGGIGLFRKQAWAGLRAKRAPFFGWTEHQHQSPWKKGWVHPALPVFLLDHLNFTPFTRLSEKYETLGWQRSWPKYRASQARQWEWKFPDWKSRRVK